MPEYRRFVAYFYEYIDGKKQGNAGFAKVELRNGMWRVLFRLTLPDAPEPPVRVYGFIREQRHFPEFLLGTMNAENHGPEEWAWRADVPVGPGNCYFEQMTGIRIQSGDGRVFLTVWDDEPVELDQFVSAVSGAVQEAASSEIPEVLPPMTPEVSAPEEPQQPTPEVPAPEEPQQPTPEVPAPEEPQQPTPEMPVPEPPVTPEVPAPEPSVTPEVALHKTSEGNPPQSFRKPVKETALRAQEENPAETLLRGRQPFRPFGDDEFFDCVQIRLCDLLPLQQEGWQVGRSNFLQHGYYLYRHLLLGRAKDGGYVVGVPGLRSQQEEYVAHTFGYDRFKLSGLRGCGRRFGYWCRVLNDSGVSRDVSDEKALNA